MVYFSVCQIAGCWNRLIFGPDHRAVGPLQSIRNQARGRTIRHAIRACQIPLGSPPEPARQQAGAGQSACRWRGMLTPSFLRPVCLMSALPLVFTDQDLHAHNTLGLPVRAAVAVLDDEAQVPALRDMLADRRAPPRALL